MRKVFLFVAFIFSINVVFAQNLTNENITILKGGITVLRFAGDISNFILDNKKDYNINIEEDRSIRIWAKSAALNPSPTSLTIIEGKRSHRFNVQYKEKGDFNSTYYDYTNLALLKNKALASNSTTKEILTTSTSSTTTQTSIDKKNLEQQRALVLAEEKRKREERLSFEQKKSAELNAKVNQENEQKLLAEKRILDEKARILAEDKLKKQAAEQRLAEEKKRQKELEIQIENERKEKLEKEAALLVEKQKRQQEAENTRLRKAEEINYANAKKAREENEKRLAEIRNNQNEQLKAIAEEKAKRDQLMALIEAEKKSQELLEQRIEAENRIKTEKLATEKKELEALAIATEKRRIEMELEQTLKAEEERIATQKKLREENEQKLALEKQKQQETIQALMNTKKEQEELIQKLNTEKQQRESLEKMLADQKLKRLQKEKELESAAISNTKPSIIKPAIEQPIVKKQEQKVVETVVTPIANNAVLQPQTNYPNSQQFPNINFKNLPQGQIMENVAGIDSLEIQSNSTTLIEKPNNTEFANASTEIDGIKIQLTNISIVKDLAYVCFEIENKNPDYFVLGATALKILDAETGKKIQLNPYSVSSFPVVDGSSSKKVVYVMKAEKNISPDSFVMITIRERQTNKKFELNFPGNLYTNAIK